MLRGTLIEGEHVAGGSVVFLDDSLARWLVAIKKAVIVPGDQPEVEKKPAAKSQSGRGRPKKAKGS